VQVFEWLEVCMCLSGWKYAQFGGSYVKVI
jgi:hypothetical protein